MITLYFELFFTFFFIGLFTIGGGYAMLSLIQAQVVTQHGWITESTFTDIIAISQMTPGPIGINSATYVGYSVLQEAGANEFLCILGSMTATIAVILPSFIIVLMMVRAYEKFKTSHLFQNVMKFLRPVVIGLIGSAAIILITPENFIDWISWVLFVCGFILTYFLKINPILVLVLGGIAGFIIY